MTEGRPPSSDVPVIAAPFVWCADGRPDWSAMWESDWLERDLLLGAQIP